MRFDRIADIYVCEKIGTEWVHTLYEPDRPCKVLDGGEYSRYSFVSGISGYTPKRVYLFGSCDLRAVNTQIRVRKANSDVEDFRFYCYTKQNRGNITYYSSRNEDR